MLGVVGGFVRGEGGAGGGGGGEGDASPIIAQARIHV